MNKFVLDERLAAECVFLADWALSRVLLRNESRFPWLILVPRKTGVAEIFDLSEDERSALVAEISMAAMRLRAWARADKMNIATLGNVVPQLHIHVVARRKSDVAWPNPPFGSAVPYSGDEFARLGQELQRVFQS